MWSLVLSDQTLDFLRVLGCAPAFDSVVHTDDFDLRDHFHSQFGILNLLWLLQTIYKLCNGGSL